MLRLFTVPFLVIEILDGHWKFAFVLLWLAGISDGLDGLLARALKQRTTLGQFLDPIADKALLSTLFLVLTHVGVIPRYVTVLVFSRDLGILLISTLLYVTNILRDFRPTWLGKLNTCLQILTVLAGHDGEGGSRMEPRPADDLAAQSRRRRGAALGRAVCLDHAAQGADAG